MSVGRIYKIRKACGSRACGSRVNYFNMDMYNEAAKSIDYYGVYDGEGYGIKVSTNSKESLDTVRSIIKSLWKWNGVSDPVKQRTFDRVAHTELFSWGSITGSGKSTRKANRDAALRILEKFATPDAISALATFGKDGYVKTSEGLTAYVDVIINVVDNPNDDPDDPDDDKLEVPEPDRGLREGAGSGNDNGGGGATYPGSGEGTGTGSSWTTWLLIGGGVLLLVIIVALFLKKKK